MILLSLILLIRYIGGYFFNCCWQSYLNLSESFYFCFRVVLGYMGMAYIFIMISGVLYMGLFFNRIENINISIHCTEWTPKLLPPILTILLNPPNHLLNNINQLQILILQFSKPPIDDFITLFGDDGH